MLTVTVEKWSRRPELDIGKRSAFCHQVQRWQFVKTLEPNVNA